MATVTKSHTTDSYIEAPELLTYRTKYVVTSSVLVDTTSTALQDDTEASQAFTLSDKQTVLAIYTAVNASNPESDTGKQTAINVDGIDYANSYDAPGAGVDTDNSITTFWIGTLPSGNHTIKGRFASRTAATLVSIDGRTLLIYVLNGNQYCYTDNTTVSTAASTAFADDPNATYTFTPSGDCKSLIIYNASNIASTEVASGKKIAINISATDYSQSQKSPSVANYSNQVLTLHYAALTTNAYTATGRLARSGTSGTVTISRRQFGILLFSDTTLADYISSDVQVNTANLFPVDDTQATISRTTTETRELLVVAMGTKLHGTSSSTDGEAYGINVDTSDRGTTSRDAPFDITSAISASTAWGEKLTTGAHTVQGRFGNNVTPNTARIDSRRVAALWFYAGAKISYTTDSLLLKTTTKTHTTDSLLYTTTKKTHTIDSLLAGTVTYTHTTDSLLATAVATKTYTTDSILRSTVTNLHTTDSLLLTTIYTIHTTDSILRNTVTDVYTTDSILRSTVTQLHNTDSILRSTTTYLHTTDSLLKTVSIKTCTTDSLLRSTVTNLHDTDSILKGIVTILYNTDSILRSTVTNLHTLDSLLLKTSNTSHTTDSIFNTIVTKSYTTDSILRSTVTNLHNTDSILKSTVTDSYTTDSIFKKIVTAIHTTDSYLVTVFTKNHTTDSLLLQTIATLHTTDSLLKVILTKTHTTDSYIIPRIIRTHIDLNNDGTLTLSVGTNFTLDLF